ncbi:hypothetical protein [Pseudomonas sp. AF03-9]|uniref:hypothetical protein n=1 Tax=Pseudomonas sp. AF03-9 TaxID=2849867 RepID=UPI001CF99C2D|nr:hypothetical protein [Pseudomonas sp. AF03-9]
MISIASEDECETLEVLQALIKSKHISAVEAWACFSKPVAVNDFKRHTVKLNKTQISNIESLRDKVKSCLKARAKKRCGYCRRALGQHGMSWHIEHIYGKTKFPDQIFKLSNLLYACIDCNMVKNNSVDRANPFVFDIINPNEPAFSYGDHLSFVQLSTEHLHILKYDHRSKEGKNTYAKLKLASLESLEIMSSLNEAVKELSERIDDRLSELLSSGENREIADFLHKIKMNLSLE